jgi:hypothetical protein
MRLRSGKRNKTPPRVVEHAGGENRSEPGMTDEKPTTPDPDEIQPPADLTSLSREVRLEMLVGRFADALADIAASARSFRLRTGATILKRDLEDLRESSLLNYQRIERLREEVRALAGGVNTSDEEGEP